MSWLEEQINTPKLRWLNFKYGVLLSISENYHRMKNFILRPAVFTRTPAECDHSDNVVPFDEKASEGLEAREVKERWPRGSFCEHCGARGIYYASFLHYIRGDW